MAKINVTLAAREITEHFAAGEHARAFQRAMIAQCLPAYVARLGDVPVYTMDGQPVNGAAIKATAERTARLEARNIAAAARNAAAREERIAAAARFADAEHAKWIASLPPVTVADVDAYLADAELTADEFSAARAELLATIH